MLQPALDQKKRVAHNRNAIFRKYIGRNDGVRNPGLIFNAQKDEALRRARPLPRNNGSRNAQANPIRKMLELIRASALRASS